jgi:predicted nuclease with TOPRIM domain
MLGAMADTLAAQSAARIPSPRPQLDRLAAFRVTYLAIFSFMLLYVVSVEVAEALLQVHFQHAVREAVRVSPVNGPIIPQIQTRVSDLLRNSIWTSWGGVRVNVTVLGADGKTPLYVGVGNLSPPPPPSGFDAAMREAIDLLPPITDVDVAVSHGSLLSASIFVGYAAILLQGLFLYQRTQARREEERMAAAVTARDDAARRARSIEGELDAVRTRLREVEPAERSQTEAIRALEAERAALQSKLRELAEREAQLRRGAERGAELAQEHQALEDLLEEALEDVGQKEREIQALQDRLAHATRGEARPKEAGGRMRESERIARRLRTLYKNLEFDDRSIEDIVALGDESHRLRAEEALKRLADEPDTAAIRRKVGGLPSHLSIFELGFAGKCRIYYTRSERGAFRILAVGGKASQKQDLEYLSRLA